MQNKLRARNKKFSKMSGFTLIELLIVIAIIAMLASIVVTALSPVKQKAADVKRVRDVKQLATALELYASDHNGTYPVATTPITAIPGLVPTYLASIPVAPTPPPPGYTATQNSYLYQTDPTGTSYTIQVTLSAPVGTGPGAIPAGVDKMTNSSNGVIAFPEGFTSYCTRAAPTLQAFEDFSNTGAPGRTLWPLVRIINGDSAGCPSSNWIVTISNLPPGFTSSMPTISYPPINPQSILGTNFPITSPNTATSGVYHFTATAVDASTGAIHNATTTGTYTIP